MTRLFLATVFLFLIAACSSNPEKDKNNKQLIDSAKVSETFEVGKIIDSVHCNINPSYSFALYLPTSYSKEKTYPVVFVLDPHADGRLPLFNYTDLAEKNNYILVGSNNSENGKSWEEANQIVSTLMADVKNRFSINTSRIYLMGFSGGARIANAVTMTDGQIEGVICCGAVSPAINIPNSRNNYSLVCIAGTADFNYTEICKYDRVEGQKTKHTLIKFDGIHEWPPITSMEDTFWFLELNEMRKTPSYKKDTVIQEIITKETNNLKDLLSKNKTIEAFEKCRKVIAYYNGLHELKEFYTTYESFKTNKEIDTKLRVEEAFWKLEDSEKQKYIEAFQKNDLNWWKINITDLNKKIKTGKKTEEVNMQKRLLSFLSLASYMQTAGALKEKNTMAADYFSTIYILVDPTNKDAHYLKAEVNALTGKKKEAIQSLNESVKNDFNDLKRLESDSLLNPIKNTKEYQLIIDKLNGH